MTRVILVLLVLAAPACARTWIGVRPSLASGPFTASGHAWTNALSVEVVPDSPAAHAGLATGDLVVAIGPVDFAGPPGGLVQRFLDAIARAKPGDAWPTTVLRQRLDRQARLAGRPVSAVGLVVPERALRRLGPDAKFELEAKLVREVCALTVVLGARDEPASQPRPGERELWPEGLAAVPAAEVARRLIAANGMDRELTQLTAELAGVADAPGRLARERFAYEHPLAMPAVARALVGELTGAPTSPSHALATAARWLDRAGPPEPPVRLAPAGLTVDQRIQEIVDVLARAKRHHDRAFARLTDDEKDWLAAQSGNLSRALVRHIYIDADVTPRTVDADLKMVALAAKVDTGELLRAAAVLASFVEASRGAFRRDLERGLTVPELRKETPFGPVIIGGKGHNWYHDDAAVIVDLGGNDLYTNNAGAARGRHLPLSVVIDYEGDDAYESNSDWSQGAGLLGVGVLADFGGNDSYIGQRWCQGAALLGVGILVDERGDDAYHAQELAQGCALWGAGLLLDGAGRDTHDATRFAQGCALPGGFAALVDASGDDTYYAKGRHPTSYGDRGFFDSYSQGCALGFRDLAAGGIAVLADLAGNDRYEAGHFSQGGGYFHGFGILYDAAGDDWYMGSRYAQGFAAHAAIGYFEDVAGNDVYGTRQCVAQGISWDQSVVAFIDGAGDDRYDGGDVSSQGYAAFDSFCLFYDGSGNDSYQYADGGGNTGPNRPGNTSVCVFIDGGGTDRYPAGTPEGDDRTFRKKQAGLFADLPGR